MDYWKWTKKNELYHHGILGQKWGKKNGPPYPLDSSDHSSSEKKAGTVVSATQSKDDKKANKRKAKNDAYIKETLNGESEKRAKNDEKKAKEYYELTIDPDVADYVSESERAQALERYISAAAKSNVVKKSLLDPISSIDTSSSSFKQVKKQVDDILANYYEEVNYNEWYKVYDKFAKDGTVR